MSKHQELEGQLDLLELIDPAGTCTATPIYVHREAGYFGMTRLTTGDVCGFCRKRPRTETHAGCSGGPLDDETTVSIRYCGKCCETVMDWMSPLTLVKDGAARLVIQEAGR